jgi:hypothetical protein
MIDVALTSCGAVLDGTFGPFWAYSSERHGATGWNGDVGELPLLYTDTYGVLRVAADSPVRPRDVFTEPCTESVDRVVLESGATLRFDGFVDAAVPPGPLPDDGRFAVDLVAEVDGVTVPARALVTIVDDPRRQDSAEPELFFLMDEQVLAQFVADHPSAAFDFDLTWWDGRWRFRAHTDAAPDLEFVSSRDPATFALSAEVSDLPSWRRGEPPEPATVELGDRPAPPEPEIDDPIVDGQWVLVSVDGVPVRSGDLPSIEFARGGVVGNLGGFDGCGSFDIAGSFGGGVLTVDSVEVQALECPDVERSVVPASGSVTLDGIDLVIAEDGGRVLRYRDLRHLTVAAVDDVLGSWVAGSGASSTLTLRADGSVELGSCDLTWSLGRGRLLVEGWPPSDDPSCIASIVGPVAKPLVSFAGSNPAPNPARVLISDDGSLLVSDGSDRSSAVRLVPGD